MDRFQRLHLLCCCLREDIADAELRTRLRREQDWPAFALRASQQMISAAVYVELARRALLDAVPADFGIYLRGLWELNSRRNRTLSQQLAEAAKVLNTIGIEPVLMKGAAALVDGLYADPGARISADLDLLVPAERLAAASQSLQALGYQRITDEHCDEEHYREFHQDAPLIHPQRLAAIELHRRYVISRRGSRLHEVLRADALPVTVGGGRALLADPTERLAHNFLHQTVQDAGYMRGAFDLRQLYEAMRLLRRYREQIRWPALFAAIVEAECEREWGAYVVSLAELFGTELPYGPASRWRSRIWFMRSRLQFRWPRLRKFNSRVYNAFWRFVPHGLRKRFGWEDYGWFR
jgi:hypothetical protein